MSFTFKDIYIELYIDLNVNIQTFCLDDDQKEELKRRLEKWWLENHREELLKEANEIVFQIRLKELVDE